MNESRDNSKVDSIYSLTRDHYNNLFANLALMSDNASEGENSLLEIIGDFRLRTFEERYPNWLIKGDDGVRIYFLDKLVAGANSKIEEGTINVQYINELLNDRSRIMSEDFLADLDY